MLSGCYHLMWAHYQIMWVWRSGYYQIMWSRETRCYRVRSIMLSGRHNYSPPLHTPTATYGAGAWRDARLPSRLTPIEGLHHSIHRAPVCRFDLGVCPIWATPSLHWTAAGPPQVLIDTPWSHFQARLRPRGDSTAPFLSKPLSSSTQVTPAEPASLSRWLADVGDGNNKPGDDTSVSTPLRRESVQLYTSAGVRPLRVTCAPETP
jgi:hypothetical protein